MPHLALPVLTSYLRSHGVEVIQRDLNAETYDTILTRSYLEQSLERLHSLYPRQSGRVLPKGLQWVWAEGPGLAARVEAAKAVYRSPAFYDGEKSLPAFLTIVRALDMASLPFQPAQLDLLNYQPASPVDDSRSLMQAVRDEQHNIFLGVFRRAILPDIVREQPDIIGISIPTMGQMLAAMTLAYLIRQAGLACHITVGGPHISMLREQIPRVPALFTLIDSAVIYDGEAPLLRLTEALDGKGDLAQVPNLIYKKNGKIDVNPAQAHPGSSAGVLPDFDGLALDRYLVPEPVLPLMAAHGCYHGLCAFCNVGYGAGKGFVPLASDQVFDQVAAVHKKYGARHIFFADEAIPPRTLRDLALRVAEEELPVHWGGCVRFERALTDELLQTMARGGCQMTLFGLETASERMIQHMIKGTQRETMSRVLQDGAKAGIWNHTFFFFGFPTETMADAQDTVNFLYAHADWVHSASPGQFVLERYSPVHLDPAKFGVTRVIEKPGRDLAIYFDYELESGLDETMAGTVVERLLDVLPTKRYGQFYVNDVYRFLFASELRRRGKPLPPWLVPEHAGTQG
jgi:hypothetical protein